MVLRILSVLLHPMNFHDTEGPVYLMDTGKIQTHTPQHLNPHPMGGNRPLWSLTIPEAKPIPLLTLQTDTTKVMKMTTPKQAVQTNPEVRAAPVGLEVPMVPGGPGGPGGPGNNPPNEQDFLREFMNLLRGVSTSLNNPRPNNILTKVKEPDTFDGSDPWKLKAFIVSLQLNFNDRPTAICGGCQQSQLRHFLPLQHRSRLV